MSRYFFHLSFGQRVVPDEEGVELPSRTAARNEALAVVRDLANPDVESAPKRWASWFLDVADEGGGTPIGHPALELVTPDAPASSSEPPDLKSVQRAPAAVARDSAALRARTTEIVRQTVERQQQMAQLLRHQAALRRELSILISPAKLSGSVPAAWFLARARSAADIDGVRSVYRAQNPHRAVAHGGVLLLTLARGSHPL